MKKTVLDYEKQFNSDVFEFVDAFKQDRWYYKVKCKICGNTQNIRVDKLYRGCKHCNLKNRKTKPKKTFEDWILDFRKIHNNNYQPTNSISQ